MSDPCPREHVIELRPLVNSFREELSIRCGDRVLGRMTLHPDTTTIDTDAWGTLIMARHRAEWAEAQVEQFTQTILAQQKVLDAAEALLGLPTTLFGQEWAREHHKARAAYTEALRALREPLEVPGGD